MYKQKKKTRCGKRNKKKFSVYRKNEYRSICNELQRLLSTTVPLKTLTKAYQSNLFFFDKAMAILTCRKDNFSFSSGPSYTMLLIILLQFPFHILNEFNLKRALSDAALSAIIQPKTPKLQIIRQQKPEHRC